MSSISSLINSFVLMIILVTFGYVLGYIFIASESVHTEFANAGVYDVSPDWQSADLGIYTLKLQRFIGYILMFFGIGQFIWTATRKEEVQYAYGG